MDVAINSDSSFFLTAALATVAAIIIIPALILIPLYQSPRMKRIKKMMSKVPGPPRIAVFGNALSMPQDQREFYLYLEGLMKEYDGFFYLSQGLEHVVVIGRGQDAEPLLRQAKHHTVKSWHYFSLFSWLRTGLLTSSGEKWHKRRKMLTPAFHFDILDNYFESMIEHTGSIVEKFISYSENQKPVDVWNDMSLCALDIISKTAMGVDLGAQRGEESSKSYVAAREGATSLIQQRSKYPWLWNDAIYFNLFPAGRNERKYVKEMHKFTTDVILKRWEELKGNMDEESTKKKHSFLDVLLLSKEKNGLSFEDIREEVDTFMFEGHDTTAAALSFLMHELSKKPEILSKLQEEVDANFSDLEFTVENLKEIKERLLNMQYLDGVIHEGLRLYPSVPIMGRTTTQDDEIRGYTIPAGVSAMISPYFIHRDPKTYPNPETFDPSRWYDKNFSTAVKRSYQYIPFSAGSRNCIGQRFALMEMKLLTSRIVKEVGMKSVEDSNHDLRLCGEVILRSLNGFRMTFSRR